MTASVSEEKRKLDDFEKRVDKDDKEAMALLTEMREHIQKLEKQQRFEDPRLSFATPEFREAQRHFTDAFKKNFNRPVEYAMVKDFPWSTPALRKLDRPVDVKGNPWPLDSEGKPILS
ncbi:unnamed protein product [Pedinophyceae sp. YPF-701]|nr:unnamed protein product [Pedinophyceae sp. YPF-701]